MLEPTIKKHRNPPRGVAQIAHTPRDCVRAAARGEAVTAAMLRWFLEDSATDAATALARAAWKGTAAPTPAPQNADDIQRCQQLIAALPEACQTLLDLAQHDEQWREAAKQILQQQTTTAVN